MSFYQKRASIRVEKVIILFRRKYWTEKYMTCTVPIKKEVTRIDKDGEETTKDIFFILQFIDRARFMTNSLSNLVSNLSEGIHRIKWEISKHDNDDKIRIWQ